MRVDGNVPALRRSATPAAAELCWSYDEGDDSKPYWSNIEERWWVDLGGPRCVLKKHKLRRRWAGRSVACAGGTQATVNRKVGGVGLVEGEWWRAGTGRTSGFAPRRSISSMTDS